MTHRKVCDNFVRSAEEFAQIAEGIKILWNNTASKCMISAIAYRFYLQGSLHTEVVCVEGGNYIIRASRKTHPVPAGTISIIIMLVNRSVNKQHMLDIDECCEAYKIYEARIPAMAQYVLINEGDKWSLAAPILV